jgi:DnaK suppressor protein
VTTASSLSALDRLHLREQLQDLWREQVEILAVVDYRAAGRRAPDTDIEKDELARQRAAARIVLVEVEAAMQRMDCRHYGRCERCAEPIPIVDLFTAPHRRRCAGCDRLQP